MFKIKKKVQNVQSWLKMEENHVVLVLAMGSVSCSYSIST